MSRYVVGLIPAQINRGYWYGIVKDTERDDKTIWSTDNIRKKRLAQRMAESKAKELNKLIEVTS